MKIYICKNVSELSIPLATAKAWS